MATKRMICLHTFFLLIILLPVDHVDAVENTCDFPSHYPRPHLDLHPCQPAFDAMVECLAFLLQQLPQPPLSCCTEVAKTWRDYPICLCKLTFYPPGHNISSLTANELLRLCNLGADLCGECPALLQLIPGPSENAPKHSYVSTHWVGFLVCSMITVVALAIFAGILWRKVRSRSLLQLHADQEIMKLEGQPTVFTYNVLKAATKNFHICCKLGEGGFGAVYKGVLQDGSEVAVKQLSTTSWQGNEEFLNEVTLITGVHHRNLVKLRGYCVTGVKRLLVFEYLENNSLHQALFDPGNRLHLDWPTRVRILVGTARGLAYLHDGCQPRIVHRDIKCSNILLDKDLNPKIADFGLARPISEDKSHVSTVVAGTRGYMAPEYAMGGQFTEKADVFSFGIVALELVSGRYNFNSRLVDKEAFLLHWTQSLHGAGNVLTVLDPSLMMEDQCSEEEMFRFVQVALLCTQSVSSRRPSMTKVVSMLTGDCQVETYEQHHQTENAYISIEALI